MKRRDFGKALAGGAVGVGLSTLIPATPLAFGQHIPDYGPLKPVTPKRNLKMHVGSDYHVIEGASIFGKENLEYNLRFGVKSISPDPDTEAHRGKPRTQASRGGDFIPMEGPVEGGAFDLDLLKRMKDSCDQAGIWLEGLRMDSGYIVLKQKSDQDKKIDQISENIRKAAQVNVHLISQHWTMIPIRRNGTAPGRGGAVYTTFKLENDWKSLPEGIAGHVSYNEYWERIEYFLKKIIPVCAEYKVAMANHPYDPPGLPYGYEGVENFDAPSIYDAFKRVCRHRRQPVERFPIGSGCDSRRFDQRQQD